MARYEGLIFDFNGVLWWDGDLQAAAWRGFSTRLRGRPLDDEEIALHVHGRNNSHTMSYLLGRPVAGHELAELSEGKETVYREMCLELGDGFRLSPGAVELLNDLTAAGLPRTIATASGWPNVDFFIRHLDLERWFDPARIIFDDGTRPGKPAPDPYLAAASVLGLEPDRCVVVEDSRSGIVAAAAAGIGLIVALGPADAHGALRRQPEVGYVIEHLGQFPRHFLADAGQVQSLEKP
jgi:beta-phosphoglucomutase-like phosphatase (HAD superfamily)